MLDHLGGGPEKREKNRAETLVSEAKQLVETASVNRLKARYAFQRIIEELPESYYAIIISENLTWPNMGQFQGSRATLLQIGVKFPESICCGLCHELC